MFLSFIILIIFAIGMLTAAIKDALTMTIPNWASVFVLMGFFLVIPFVWQGWSVFGLHMLTGLGMFVFGFVLFAMGWLGGGDAKLMAATSFWWMPQDLFLYVFYTTAAGGSLAILIRQSADNGMDTSFDQGRKTYALWLGVGVWGLSYVATKHYFQSCGHNRLKINTFFAPASYKLTMLYQIMSYFDEETRAV